MSADPHAGTASWRPRIGAITPVRALTGARSWARAGRLWPLHIAAIVGLAALVFANALQNGFHLDDYYRVVNNPAIETLSTLGRHFVDPYTSATIPEVTQYRPLLPVSLSLSYALFGDSVVAYHLGNLLFQIIAGILVYALARELLGRWGRQERGDARVALIALATALLFTLHPVSGILVNYISGRDLLLMQVFLSASLLCYVRMRRLGGTPLRWAATLALLELAMLAKTNAVIAPALVLAFELTVAGSSPRRLATYLRTLPFALVLAAHFAYITFYLHFSDLAANLDRSSGAWLLYPLTQAKVHLFHYLVNFVWPFLIRQQPAFSPARGLADVRVLIGLALIAASLWLAVRLLRRRPLAAFCIAAYWIALLPESSFVPMLRPVVDYRPYPASPFLFLLVVLLLERYLRPAQAVYAAGALVVFVSCASIGLNTTWRTDNTLWSYSVRYGGDALAHLNLAMSYPDRRDPRVRANLEAALALDPSYALAYMNLGLLLIDLGQPRQGLADCLSAVRLAPQWAMGRYWLAAAYRTLGRDGDAAAQSATAAYLDWTNVQYKYQAALDAQRLGNFQGSLAYLRSIVATYPGYSDALFALGYADWKLGQTSAAIATYQAYLQTHPTHVQARFDLAYALMTQHRYREALAQFKQTLARDPAYVEIHYDLVRIYQALGNRLLAAQQLRAYRTATARR